MSIDCLCAGIFFTDVICSPLRRMPESGQLELAERIRLSTGGCASNAALDLARLGIRVGAAGCVGDDVFGQFVLDTLTRGGVDTRGMHRIGGINTATTMAMNVCGQDRRFICSIGANTQMTVEHIPADWARQAKVFYLGGYLMLPGLETAAMVEQLRAARAAGNTTVVDVVYIGGDHALDAIALLLPETDVFLPNEDEAALVTGRQDPLDQAQLFRDLGARTVIVTRGEKGSLLLADGLRLRAGVYPAKFVDGTGSGDAFDAGYIAGLLAGEDPIGCLRWGSALGASCVRAIGATEGVFNRAEAEAFLRANRLEIEEF
jgi:sugar/nucleoside kinase (ribokinase family)